MKKITLFLACSLVIACGDDDRGDDTTTDTVMPMDMGPGVDLGPPADFGPPPDLGPGVDMGPGMSMCPAGACDLVAGTGCDTSCADDDECMGGTCVAGRCAGLGCYFLRPMDGEPAVPLCAPAGTVAEGADCSFGNECQEGLICAGDPGVCRRICCGGNNDDCNPTTTGQLCLINFVDDDGEDTGLGACQLPDDCDPVAQTGCDGTDACFLSGEGAFSCRAPGSGTQGASCDAGCAVGFTCIVESDSGICVQVCDTADPVCDAAGTSCGPIGGYEDIGVCVAG